MNMRRVHAPKRKLLTGFRAALLALSAASAPILAAAQTPPSPGASKSPEYETSVKSLANVFGALHSLYGNCNGGDQTWRLNMQSLLDREGAPGAPLRVGMINAFNDGYQEQQQRYPTCSSGAKAAQKNFGSKGGAISRRLAQMNY